MQIAVIARVRPEEEANREASSARVSVLPPCEQPDQRHKRREDADEVQTRLPERPTHSAPMVTAREVCHQ